MVDKGSEFKLFSTLAEISPHPVILLDGTTISYANPKAVDFFGADCKGRDFLEFLDERGKRLVKRALRGEGANFELNLCGKMVQLKVVPVKPGKSIAIALLPSNAESAYKKIFENTPNPIAVIDSNGIFKEANPSMVSSIGFNPVSKSLFDVFPPEIAEKRFRYIKLALAEKTVVEFEDERDGRQFISYCIPVEADGEWLCFVIVQDISEFSRMKKLLEEIIEVNEAMARVRNKDELIERVEEILSDYSAKILSEPEGDVCFSISYSGRNYGYLCVKRTSISEQRLFKALAEDIAFAFKTIEEEQKKEEFLRRLVENTKVIAYLVDRIRNPLAAIRAFAEILIADEEVRDRITLQVDRIVKIIEGLDKSWQESEEIVGKVDYRDFLYSGKGIN